MTCPPQKCYPPQNRARYNYYKSCPPYYKGGPYENISYEPPKVVVEKRSYFTFWTFVLYLILFFAGFLVGYFAFAFKRSPSEQAYYSRYPSALLGDSDVF